MSANRHPCHLPRPEKPSFAGSRRESPDLFQRLMGASRSTVRIWADFGICRQRFRKPCAAKRKTL